jgi:hypothetical protein
MFDQKSNEIINIDKFSKNLNLAKKAENPGSASTATESENSRSSS